MSTNSTTPKTKKVKSTKSPTKTTTLESRKSLPDGLIKTSTTKQAAAFIKKQKQNENSDSFDQEDEEQQQEQPIHTSKKSTNNAENKRLTEVLQSLHLEEYELKFKEEAIDWKVAIELTDEDLKQIGISKLGDRKRLLSAIQKARNRPECSAMLMEWETIARQWFARTKSSLEENVEKRLKLGLAQFSVLEIVKRPLGSEAEAPNTLEDFLNQPEVKKFTTYCNAFPPELFCMYLCEVMTEHWSRPVRCNNYNFVINFDPLPALSTKQQLSQLTFITKYGRRALGTASVEQ